jgi:hypothetical protein
MKKIAKNVAGIRVYPSPVARDIARSKLHKLGYGNFTDFKHNLTNTYGLIYCKAKSKRRTPKVEVI